MSITGSDLPIKQPDFTRPTFSITFDFTDFTSTRNLDVEALAEAVFDLLCSGPPVLDDFAYSCDGVRWDEAEVS